MAPMAASLLKFLGLLYVMRAAQGQQQPAAGLAKGKGGGGGGGGGAAPDAAATTAPPAAQWPAAAPSTLPAFPDGWEHDVPVPPDVQARGVVLLPQLWARGEGSIAQEQTGGRWITYQAATVPGPQAKGVIAWRVKGTGPAGAPPAAAALPAAPAASPVIPVGPAALPPAAAPAAAPAPAIAVQVPAAAAAAQTPAQRAALAMSAALEANGYRQTDQPVYKAFQRYAMGAANPDGFPGTKTMAALYAALDELGQVKPPVKVYPWLSSGGYDGVNAPSASEWNR
jgi:hypothetical protein